MPCFHPLKGYRSTERNPSGKYSLVFDKRKGYADLKIEVPCGGCIGCRLERSRQWAIRCVHEAKMHNENAFVTLTYSDENLPDDGGLRKGDFQKFMKRLRFEIAPKKVRFFHCGEYGDQFGRPHYHACLFGHDFEDKKEWKKTNGQTLYVSETLSRLWPFGFATTGLVTFESAAYVARYVTKKVTGPHARYHYTIEHPETGELVELEPEYVTMSRRPGIAKGWWEKYKDDVFPNDLVVVRGKPMKPPKFYLGQFERENPSEHARLKQKRKVQGEGKEENRTTERLRVRETLEYIKAERRREQGSK